MNVGEALQALKEGEKITRTGWASKNTWVRLILGTEMRSAHLDIRTKFDVDKFEPGGVFLIVMHHASGALNPEWEASCRDMLSEDWEILP